jgi:hypothetical protein
MNSILEDLLLKLKVIGKLGTQDASDCKLSFRGNEPGLERQGMFTWMSRWYNGDSRDFTVTFIQKTVSECKEVTNLYMSSTFLCLNDLSAVSDHQRQKASDIVSCLQMLLQELEEALKGIDALKNTYRDNGRIQARLDITKNHGERIVLLISNAVEKYAPKKVI